MRDFSQVVNVQAQPSVKEPGSIRILSRGLASGSDYPVHQVHNTAQGAEAYIAHYQLALGS